MSEKKIKFNDDVKPPYHGKIKAPNRIADMGETWYMMVGEGQKDGPYTRADMRGFFEADLFEYDDLCTNEGIDGNYYKIGLIFYPNIQNAFLPDDLNPLSDLEHRTAAASAEISRLADKREWNKAADGKIIKLPNTDTDPVEGEEELKWFLHHGNPKWVNKYGESISFGEAVRRDFIMIGDSLTMFEFIKLDPRMYPHNGDGMLRIKMSEEECATNGMQTTICIKEMMIFTQNDVLYKLYPVLNGSKRYLIACNGPIVSGVVFFAGGSEKPVETTDRPTPCHADLSEMKYISVSELLGFNSETIKNTYAFSKNPVVPSTLNVVDDSETLNVVLTHGRHWRLVDWGDNIRHICIRFTPEGHIIHESSEIIGSWSIKREGSFALYQDERDWTTIYREKVRRRVQLEMIGGKTHNMYVLKDTTSSLFYLHEELAYFQIIGGRVTMADISGRNACEAVRIV